MDTMETLYDVMLYGIQEGKDRIEVARAIAKSFSMELEKADQLLEREEATLVKKGVSSDLAHRMTEALTRAGAKANCKPSIGGTGDLSLVPKTSILVCPGCKERLEYHIDQEAPRLCPRCGLVFAKYKEAHKRKQEVEAVRTRLKLMEAGRDEDAKRKQEQEEEERNRKRLEDQLRKEMGIPAGLNKRWKFVSSAAATLILGLGAGGAATFFFLDHQGRLKSSASLALQQTSDGLGAIEGALNAEGIPGGSIDGTLSPAQQASTEDLIALSQGILEQAGVTADLGAVIAATTTDDIRSSSTSAAGGAFGQVNPRARDPDPLHRLTTQDPEWSRLIELNALDAVTAGNGALAVSLARRLPPGPERITALARIGAAARHHGQSDAAHTLTILVTDEIAPLTSPLPKIDALTRALAAYGQPEARADAAALINQTKQLALATQSAPQRAEAWARIALAEARLGMSNAARESLRQATLRLGNPMSPSQHIRIDSYLAAALFRLGSKDTAIGILDKSTSGLERISTTAEQDRARLDIADAWLRIGNLDRAIAASRGASDPRESERFLLALIQEQAFSGKFLGLASIADSITTPEHRLRAHVLLGSASERQSSAAQTHFQQGLASIKDISTESERRAAQAELARVLVHAGYEKTGKQMFIQLENELQQANAGPERDRGWAILAINRARAFEPSAAREYLSRVTDPDVQRLASRQLADIAGTLDTMQAVPPSKT
ncbi:hypothetical protein ThidrDRAFT_3124 [Thiorhodococcus drewsii AZ1]|uniref:Uncharacterized protein n=1 Tax=Thiorhodococcus drewsii AZ1 TaxID=765913 RepID=G2E4B1_9GAMM|nr:hypothetical protein [Thiorhodococcus drewsii]EGV29680.1 hypothetical protein ThidrDRAFT_3124 [Thiorhodococcus drewsii AZ1]